MPRDTKLRQMNFPRRYKAHTVIQQSKNGARKKFGFFKSVSLFHFPGSSERLTRIHHTRSVPFVFLSSFLSFFFLSRIELSKKCHQIQSVTPPLPHSYNAQTKTLRQFQRNGKLCASKDHKVWASLVLNLSRNLLQEKKILTQKWH